jgi:membrane-associated phospholipid phosphatase
LEAAHGKDAMHYFGSLGHVVLLAPLAAATLLYLTWIGARRDAAALLFALMVCLVATVLSKLLLATCGVQLSALPIESPSGHESFAAAVYGGLAALLATGRPVQRQLAFFAAAAALVLLVGLGRIASGAHTPAEVAVGLMIGLAAVLLFEGLRQRPQRIDLPWRRILIASPAVVAVAFLALRTGAHWTPEYAIDRIGERIGAYYGLCA